MFSKLLAWLQVGQDKPGALTWMSLGPDGASGNALMVNLSDSECALLPDL